MSLQIYFDVTRSQDLAAVDVQNAVKLAEPQLPDAVRQNGITILKANTDILGVVALTSNDPRYDATYLTNYMKLYVVDEIKRVPGHRQRADLRRPRVLDAAPARPRPDGAARHHGERRRRRGARAERHEPRRAAGREPAPPGTELTLPVTTLGRLQDARAVRRHRDPRQGRRLDRPACATSARRCSARGATIWRAGSTARPMAPLLLYLRAGRQRARGQAGGGEAHGRAARATFRRACRYKIPFDTTPFVTASIKEVVTTLVEAMLLVTLVVFIFLQSWRATLIPMLAVPVSVDRHVPRPAAARVLDQRADAVRAGARDRHRGGRRDRRDREHRAHHGQRGALRRASPPTAPSGRWPAR